MATKDAVGYAERPVGKQIQNLSVEFKQPYTSKPAIKFNNACTYIENE